MEKHLNSMLVHNKTVVEQPIKLESLAKKLTDKSVEFLEKHNANVGSAEKEIRDSQAPKPFALFHIPLHAAFFSKIKSYTVMSI